MEENVDKEKVKMIHHYSRALYELLEEGDYIDLSWPEEKKIVVMGQPKKMERIIINRPKRHIVVQVNKQ